MLDASQNYGKKNWFSFYENINIAHKCNICSVFDFFLQNLWLKTPIHTHRTGIAQYE